ncbi:MAG TPA: hypothetical protein VGF75_06260 [Candidatus Saccharimonadales bacterium]|jgi:hypothetical protein
MDLVTARDARHIQINPGNVLAVGVLSLLWWGAATWGSYLLAKQDWPVISPLAVGAQNYLHAA